MPVSSATEYCGLLHFKIMVKHIFCHEFSPNGSLKFCLCSTLFVDYTVDLIPYLCNKWKLHCSCQTTSFIYRGLSCDVLSVRRLIYYIAKARNEAHKFRENLTVCEKCCDVLSYDRKNTLMYARRPLFFMIQWRHVATRIRVNIGSGNGLLLFP